MVQAHSTDLYAIGKGILWIGEWSGTTPPTDPAGYEDMGNAPSVEIEPTVEKLPHYSSRSEFRTKDKNPVIQSEYVLNFDLEEVSTKNVNRFLMGSLSGSNIVQALQETNKEFAIKFVSDNPLGPNQVWRFWRGTLSPNGALQLIGEEWMTMSYTFEGLADVANNPNSPYFSTTFATTTTTTT